MKLLGNRHIANPSVNMNVLKLFVNVNFDMIHAKIYVNTVKRFVQTKTSLHSFKTCNLTCHCFHDPYYNVGKMVTIYIHWDRYIPVFLSSGYMFNCALQIDQSCPLIFWGNITPITVQRFYLGFFYIINTNS